MKIFNRQKGLLSHQATHFVSDGVLIEKFIGWLVQSADGN